MHYEARGAGHNRGCEPGLKQRQQQQQWCLLLLLSMLLLVLFESAFSSLLRLAQAASHVGSFYVSPVDAGHVEKHNKKNRTFLKVPGCMQREFTG